MPSLRKHATAITLRDLRIAKIGKKMPASPCQQFLEAYLTAFADNDGDENQVPVKTRLALHRCLEDKDVSWKTFCEFECSPYRSSCLNNDFFIESITSLMTALQFSTTNDYLGDVQKGPISKLSRNKVR